MKNTTPFGSEKVIIQHISEADLKTYFVGFDLNDDGHRIYRWKSFINILKNVIHEFAFGHHEGTETPITKTANKLSEAAKSIYKIKVFKEVKKIYVDDDCEIDDDDIDRKYLKRGEFGELILHLLLRDFHNTIPLLSKIYFKDSDGLTVHGFDAVHIHLETKTLWLGESKLYNDGKKGVKALIDDIVEHFKEDYMRREFALISKKIKPYETPQKDYWINLMDENTKLEDLFQAINIPLVCTYTSNTFSKYDNEKLKGFIDDYEQEVRSLKKYFDENNDHVFKTNLNIILLLFPVQSKKKLVKKMHKKLDLLQRIED